MRSFESLETEKELSSEKRRILIFLFYKEGCNRCVHKTTTLQENRRFSYTPPYFSSKSVAQSAPSHTSAVQATPLYTTLWITVHLHRGNICVRPLRPTKAGRIQETMFRFGSQWSPLLITSRSVCWLFCFGNHEIPCRHLHWPRPSYEMATTIEMFVRLLYKYVAWEVSWYLLCKESATISTVRSPSKDSCEE